MGGGPVRGFVIIKVVPKSLKIREEFLSIHSTSLHPVFLLVVLKIIIYQPVCTQSRPMTIV